MSNSNTESEVDNLKRRLEVAQEALESISQWRKECHEYDDDMQHELRDFDDENWELVEEYAANTLKEIKEL